MTMGAFLLPAKVEVIVIPNINHMDNKPAEINWNDYNKALSNSIRVSCLKCLENSESRVNNV